MQYFFVANIFQNVAVFENMYVFVTKLLTYVAFGCSADIQSLHTDKAIVVKEQKIQIHTRLIRLYLATCFFGI